MDDYLSTAELGWLLDRSPEAIRQMIRDGAIEGTRLSEGFRIPRAEVLRLSRDRIQAEAGRKLSDRQLERLIDQVIETNQAALDHVAGS
jgi:hypothetical protein